MKEGGERARQRGGRGARARRRTRRAEEAEVKAMLEVMLIGADCRDFTREVGRATELARGLLLRQQETTLASMMGVLLLAKELRQMEGAGAATRQGLQRDGCHAEAGAWHEGSNNEKVQHFGQK